MTSTRADPRVGPEPTAPQSVREALCPKHMVHGPCGGVRADGACELDDRSCPFVGRALATWRGAVPETSSRPHPLADPGIIVTDFRVAPTDRASITAVAAVLRGGPDFVLLGHHGGAAVNFPPSFLAAAALDEGLVPWVTVACRDRDASALGSELSALAALSVAGVHCVTGDYVGPDVAPNSRPVFDLDSFELVALARAHGLSTSVAASPLSPPVAERPARLAEKVRAGAGACFVNHVGPAETIAAFVGAARAAGSDVPFVPCIPVVTDRFSADVLRRFPGVVLPSTLVEAIMGAVDPVTAGVAAAIDMATRVLAIEGVSGVNLSGAACGGSPEQSAAIMNVVAEGIRSRG